jgi:hypothetical protein
MKKIIFYLLALVLVSAQGFAQGSLSVPSTAYNTGSISVPITASGFNDVGGFSLKLTVNASSSLSTVDLDTNGTILSGSGRNADLSISVTGNTVTINYTDLSVGSGFNLNGTVPLVNLTLNFNGTPSAVIWDTDPNATSFSDAQGANLPISTFTNGIINVTGSGAVFTSLCTDVSGCENASATFAITTTTATSYQWQISTDTFGTSFSNISGATDSSYTRSGLNLSDDRKFIQCLVTGTNGTILSCARRLNVLENQFRTLTLSNNATSNAVCRGGSVTFSAGLNSAATNPVYTWTVNGTVDNSTNGNTLTLSPSTNPTVVSVALSSSSGCLAAAQGSTLSNSITVNNNPSNFIVNGGGGYCAGGTGVSITLSGSETGVTYTLLRGGASTGSTTSGTGSGLTFSNITTVGNYTISASNASGCSATMSSSANVSINALPAVTATTSQNTIYLGGGTANLGVTTNDAGLNYSWSVSGGNNGQLSSTNTASPVFTPDSAGSYTLTLTATNASNCQATSTVNITVNAAPTIILSPVSVCQGSTFDLSTTVSVTGASGGTGTWSGSGVSGTNFVTTGLAVNTYTLTYTYSLQSVDYTATVNAVVKANSTASISAAICQGASYSFGSQNLTTANTYTRTITSANGCDSVITLTLSVNPLPTTAISARTTTIFLGDTTSLFGSSGMTAYSWTISAGPSTSTGQLSSTTTQNPIFTPSNAGTYTLQYTGTAASTCQNTSATLNIVVSTLSVDAGSDFSVCESGNNSNSVSLSGTPTGGSWSGTGVSGNSFNPVGLGAGTYTLTYSVTIGSVTTTDSLVATVKPTFTSSYSATICQGDSIAFGNEFKSAAGTYTRTVAASNSCDSTITLNLSVTTVTATATATGSTTVCQGNSVTLNANTGTGLTYQWKRNGTDINGATNASLTANSSGTYTVVVTELGCTSVSSGVVVTINNNPSVSVSPNPGTSITLGNTVTLNATAGLSSYSWSPTTNLSNGTIASPVFTPNTDGSFTYTVTGTDANGCSGTASVTITVTLGTPTWSGTGNWSSSGNWSTNSVPTAGADVIISSGTVTVSDDRSVGNITINSGATVNIATNQSLDVSGAINNSGTLSVAHQGALVQGTGSTVTGNGTYRLIRSTGNSNDTIYNYMSSPVEGATIGMLGATDTRNHYTYNASTGWVRVNTSTTMGNGIGYSSTGTTNGEVTFTANSNGNKFNNGTVNTTISGAQGIPAGATDSTKGWNLVGNPYPSAISAATFLNDNPNLFQQVWFWSQVRSTVWTNTIPLTMNGDYASWNTTGGVAGSQGGGIPNGLISPAQGFFVKVPEANSNLNSVAFNNAQRSTSDATVFRSTPGEKFWVNLEGPFNTFNQVLLAHSSSATAGYDAGQDGVKAKGNPTLALYSLLNNQAYCIQAQGSRTHAIEKFNLGYDAAFTGLHTIRLAQTQGVDPLLDIMLLDNQTGLRHNLRQASYTFANNQAGVFTNRFEFWTGYGLAASVRETNFNKLYVIPSNGNLQLKGLESNEEVRAMDLVDLTGKTIGKIKGEIGQSEFALPSNLSKGVYFARIQTNLRNETLRFVNP